MHFGDVAQAPGVRERLNGFRHAAGEEVGSQGRHEAIVDCRIQPALHLERSYGAGEALCANGFEMLGEGHRAHVQVANAAHRHGRCVVGEGEVQQRARRQHGEFGHVLPKVAQRRDGLRHGLDFIKEQQAISVDRPNAGQRFKDVQQMGWIIAGEGGPQVGMALQVHLHQGKATAFGKQTHQGGFADLPSAANDQRLPIRCRQPVVEKRELVAVHGQLRCLIGRV